MHQRLKVYFLSGTLVAILVVGIAIQQGVFAQDDGDDPTAPSTTSAQSGDTSNAQATDANAEAALKYKDFIETVAANLGVSDPMVVDTVIKNVLTQTIDEQVKSGGMTQDAATKVEARIQ